MYEFSVRDRLLSLLLVHQANLISPFQTVMAVSAVLTANLYNGLNTRVRVLSLGEISRRKLT